MGMTFENRDVIGTAITMPNASGGLNKALAVNDLVLHHGDEGALVIWYRVKDIHYPFVKDTDCLQRVQVLDVTNASPIDESDVAKLLEEQQIRQEEHAGVTRLPYAGDDGEGAPAEVGD